MLIIDAPVPESCTSCWIFKNMGCRIANASGWLTDRRDENCPIVTEDELVKVIKEETKRLFINLERSNT